jgi:hypothetical protein
LQVLLDYRHEKILIIKGLTAIKIYKLNNYCLGMLILLNLFMNMVFANEEVGRCYEAIPKYFPTPADSQPNKNIEGFEMTGYCVFAWRLQQQESGKYILDTTAGKPGKEGNSVLIDNGRLILARGPLHDGKIPEWTAKKIPFHNSAYNVWGVIAEGLITKKQKKYARQVICDTSIVKDEAGVNYADGCYTYNYSLNSSKPWGYLGSPGGAATGGPFMPKSPDLGSVCASIDTSDLISGEFCTNKEKLQMPQLQYTPEPKRHKTNQTNSLTDKD